MQNFLQISYRILKLNEIENTTICAGKVWYKDEQTMEDWGECVTLGWKTTLSEEIKLGGAPLCKSGISGEKGVEVTG